MPVAGGPMRLVSFRRSQPASVEAGVVVDGHVLPARQLVDIAHAEADRDVAEALRSADPVRMPDLLEGWSDTRPLLEAGLDQIDPTRGLDPDELQLLAPVPQPPSLRDFYAFPEHVEASWKRRGEPVPDAWYDIPVFYVSNPAAIYGPEEPVPRPKASQALDFELEAAWVVGERARDLDPEEAEDAIVGLTIMDDFSARDLQREEMSVGLGPSKGKDFATGLGPAIVTLDELPRTDEGGFDLEMRAYVNGEQVSEGNLDQLHHPIDEMAAHASADTWLQPGDVMGTGTVGSGSILDHGTEDWLEPGDEVRLEIDELGSLTNEIVAADELG
jgi:fumarylacetoacetate (FAA) hydrolase